MRAAHVDALEVDGGPYLAPEDVWGTYLEQWGPNLLDDQPDTTGRRTR